MATKLVLYVDFVSQPARALSLLCKAISVPHQEIYVNLLKGKEMDNCLCLKQIFIWLAIL